jgi:hypothetical protein
MSHSVKNTESYEHHVEMIMALLPLNATIMPFPQQADKAFWPVTHGNSLFELFR